jgi:hypothetical protein
LPGDDSYFEPRRQTVQQHQHFYNQRQHRDDSSRRLDSAARDELLDSTTRDEFMDDNREVLEKWEESVERSVQIEDLRRSHYVERLLGVSPIV